MRVQAKGDSMEKFTSAISGQTILVNMNKITYIELDGSNPNSMWIHFDNGEKTLVKRREIE